MTIDNLLLKPKMTYAEFMKRKKEREEWEKKNNPVKDIKDLKVILDEKDLLFLSQLVDYFYEEVPQKLYNEFLEDYCYKDEDMVRVMAKLKRNV
jgi:hypothetical protein